MYLKPDITNLAALDSCYFDSENKTLWVFQSSLFLVHPIKHSGLTDIIKIMKLESNCDDTNFIIKFLFIVPANIADLYKKQNIINRSKVPTVERLRDTLDLSGIGQAKKRKLAESGIVSEKDLYKAVSNKEFAKYSSIKKIGDQFKLDVDQQAHTSSVLAKIDSMEQFVMGLDSFKYTELKSTKLGLF
jgi:hypothetical protein